MKPKRLAPSFVERIWGSHDLSPLFGQSERKIGEVWFTGDPPLPILVKFLFTTEKLSVQVHPQGPCGVGKTEMWHILRATGDARIALGFREPVTRERLREAARSGEIEQLLRWTPVRAGETYFAPAGTVHAIGAGITLCEVQQNSDVTYRLYDYGRPRELHLAQGVEVADLSVHPGVSVPDGRSLVRCEHFVTEWLDVSEIEYYTPDASRFHLLICLEGSGQLDGVPLTAGDVFLIPAGAERFAIEPRGRVRLLRTYVPS